MNNNKISVERLVGSILLIAGCCIGAGMLGLPVLTALGGFFPTSALFTLSWLFMASTGLLLLEVNLWFKEEVSIVTMAETTLGSLGKIVSWLLFAFLFYSMMVSYAAGSGQLLSDFANALNIPLSEALGSFLFCLSFGFILYKGIRSVDQINRLLMLGLVVTYLILVSLGSNYVHIDYLFHSSWSSAVFAVPLMIISFGFHNLVPSLTTYLRRDRKKLQIAIILGSAIPLLVYLVWELVILGIVPLEGTQGVREAVSQGEMATRMLRRVASNTWIVPLAETFAFFAIITSFLGVSISFVDFLADGLKVKKDFKGKILLSFLSLTPPFLLSLIYPRIFLVAQSYAGAYGAVVLFGIMPALMVWSGRYQKKIEGTAILPGGRVTLFIIIALSFVVITLETLHQIY